MTDSRYGIGNVEKLNEEIRRQKREAADQYRLYAEYFRQTRRSFSAYLFAEIGLKIDPENTGLKDLIAKL